MQNVNVREYLAQGNANGLLAIVALEGNEKNWNVRNVPLALKKLDIMSHENDLQYRYLIIPSYNDAFNFITEENNNTGLGEDFEGGPILAEIIGNNEIPFKIIVVQNENDQEGVLLEHGDALLVSNRTSISNQVGDVIGGTETYNVACMSADDFAQHFKPYINSSFRPLKEPKNKLEMKTGADQTAPYAEQLDAIIDWPNKDFEKHYKYITERLKKDFTASLSQAYEDTLRSGGSYEDFDCFFEEISHSIASGCTDALGSKEDYYYLQRSVVRDLMNEDGFEEELRQEYGDEHVEGVVNDWAEHALENAKNSEDAYNLNPNKLAEYFREKASKPENVIYNFTQYAGDNKTLMLALREKFSAPCLDAFEKVAQASAGKIPLVGGWIADRATDKYAQKMGFAS